MLNVHNLSVSFMGSDLFSGITFKLNKGDRIGLIGKNGAGKSTLLKVLSKDIENSGGTMAFDKDIRIGFLRQDIDFVEGRTILEEACEPYLLYLEKKDLKLNYNILINSIRTDKDMFKTIIGNLFYNAIKFSSKGKEIIISAKKENNQNVFIVEDKGTGMAENVVDNLFILDRKDNVVGTDNEKGSGLGLIICKEFIELLKGSIKVESQIGLGTKVYIYFKNN